MIDPTSPPAGGFAGLFQKVSKFLKQKKETQLSLVWEKEIKALSLCSSQILAMRS